MKKYRFTGVILLLTLITTLLSPLAAATSGSEILDSMEIASSAALLVNNDYGEVLYAQNAYDKMYPASITKVMTALLVIEAIERGELALDQVITVSGDLYNGVGADSSTANISMGEEMSVYDLLMCTLVKSANEACNALAVAVAGDVDEFVVMMNQRARELGMENSNFANTHGYHNDNHYTTAWDIYLMCSAALEHDLFAEFVSTRSYTVPATNMSEERVLYNTNGLISTYYVTGYFYEYAIGIKTGSTGEAGLCLASAATKDGTTLISVVLGAASITNDDGTTDRQQFSESSRLLEWGFDNFAMETILDTTYIPAEVEVTLSEQANYVTVQANDTIQVILPVDLDPTTFDYDWELFEESVVAPVEEGQVMGTVTVSYGDTVYGTVDLVARNSVERSETLYQIEQVTTFVDQTWVKVVALVIVVLLLVVFLRLAIFGRSYSAKRGSRKAYSGRKRR